MNITETSLVCLRLRYTFCMFSRRSGIRSGRYPKHRRTDASKIADVVHCRGNLEIKKLFKEIISTFWNGTPQSVSKNSVLLHMLLLRASEAENAGSGSEADMTERCINIINSHPERFVSPEEMARALFVSERTLRNAFKRSHNTTPYNYQRDLKLKRAIALMREYPEMTMREIALNLGFADDSHFSKVFKSVYGVSPANYKNSLAEKDEVPGNQLHADFGE